MAVIGELMRYGHHVDERGIRRGACRRCAAAFHVAQGILEVGHGLDAWWHDVPLGAEPPGYIALRTLQPRIDEDIKVRAAWWWGGILRVRNLDEPGCVGVEVDEKRSAIVIVE